VEAAVKGSKVREAQIVEDEGGWRFRDIFENELSLRSMTFIRRE
jgi:hypothetical protein